MSTLSGPVCTLADVATELNFLFSFLFSCFPVSTLFFCFMPSLSGPACTLGVANERIFVRLFYSCWHLSNFLFVIISNWGQNKMRSQLIAQFTLFSSAHNAFSVSRQKVPYFNVSRQNRVVFNCFATKQWWGMLKMWGRASSGLRISEFLFLVQKKWCYEDTGANIHATQCSP